MDIIVLRTFWILMDAGQKGIKLGAQQPHKELLITWMVKVMIRIMVAMAVANEKRSKMHE